MRSRISRSIGGNIVSLIVLILIGAFIALPLYYTIINAFKPLNELFLFPPRFIVLHPTLDNFAGILRVQSQSIVPIERTVFNSVFVTVVSTIGYIVVASMAGYAMAQMTFPGKRVINTIVVFAILFTPAVTALPQYMLMAQLGILDTYLAVILPQMSTSFGVFLMTQFIGSVPKDILEAARIDGAGEKYTFFRIVMPMVKPAWLTLMIFTFIGIWAATGAQVLYSESMKLLPTVLQQINSAGISRTGVAAAATMLLMLPPMIIFLFCQNAVVETMAYSGIKD